jgi:dinuclear metal center YbgI/SA1388 family protein
MQLSRIVEQLERIAPPALAESWDNVGLLVGDANQNISRVMLTIDYTPAVAAEAKSLGCDLIVAYHPPIFHAIKRLTSPNLIFDAVRRGVAIYSPHTALDSAKGGTNDMLADAIGLTERTPLRISPSQATHYKLVFFVPAENLEAVTESIFSAGAGDIGKYSRCSFRCEGTGTFFGNEGTNPAIGRSGKLERVEEIRVETLVPIAKVADVVRALRKSHPYEEPAFDLNVLAATENGGQGRIGTMPATERSAIFERVRRELGIQHLLIAGPTDGTITRAAVCAGSCGEMLDNAIKAGAQLYLTGEMRHHEALKAAAHSLTVVCTLHSNSERAVLKRLKKRLEETEGICPIMISQSDRDPFVIR